MGTRRRGFLAHALAIAPMALVVALRLAGPTDLDRNDQAKQALYVLDIWERGNWILPLEQGEIPATKPPLYAWLATATSTLSGGPTELACRIPSALAALAAALLIFRLGRERWGDAVGVAAASFFAVSHTVTRLAIHVRPDMVLALLVTLCFFALHRAEQGRGARMAGLFWGALSLSALTKGPVGPLVVAAPVALLATSREARGWLWPVLRSPWVLTLLAPLAWFGAALWVGGSGYFYGTVLSETVDRVVGGGRFEGGSRLPGYLLFHFLGDFAPWSPLALCGAWLALSRRDLRLPAAWLVSGLILFNLSMGQRADYLLPLLPAGALLAGAALADPRPLARHLWRALAIAVGAAALGLAGAGLLGVGRLGVLAGPYWSGAAAAAGLGLLAVGCVGRWMRAPLDARPLAIAVTSLLMLHAAYNQRLSPTARSGRGAEVASFARDVAAVQGGAPVALYGAVTNAVRFRLRCNQPSLSEDELSWYLARADYRERLLVVTAAANQGIVQARFGDAVRVRLRAPIGSDSQGGLVLLETGESS